MADYTSAVVSGNWNDTATWGGGGYPSQAGDTATIQAGHTVTYNVDSQVILGKVTVAGTLIFSRAMDTELVVPASAAGELEVVSGGVLDVGTGGSPIPEEYHAWLTADFSSVGANTNPHPGYLVQSGGASSFSGNNAKYRKISYPNYGIIEQTFDGTHSPAQENLKCRFTGSGGQKLAIFTYTITDVRANMPRTLYCYAMRSDGWSTPPTYSQIYLDAEYPNGVGTTAHAYSANAPNTYWTRLSVTFTPRVTGDVTVTCYLSVSDGTEYVLVEPALYCEDPGGTEATPNPNLVKRGSTLDLSIPTAPFGGARNIAVMPNGNMVFGESTGYRIRIVDTTGATVTEFGEQGSGEGQIAHMAQVAVDTSGNIYVTDQYFDTTSKSRVVIFNSSGVYQRQIVVPDADQIWKDTWFAEGHRDHEPYCDGIAVGADGRIFIVDNALMRVVILENNGTIVNKHVGQPGTAPGSFFYPGWCALNDLGTELHICNGFNRRIEVFDVDGNYLRNYGNSTSFIGSFFGATGITFDDDGNAIVCDAMMYTIQAFDGTTGEYLYHVGENPPTVDEGNSQRLNLGVGLMSGIVYHPGEDWIVVSSGYGMTPALQCRTVLHTVFP